MEQTICCVCEEPTLRARWTGVPGEYVCKDCAPELEMRRNVPGSVFPFVTMHLNPEHPEPIKVKNLRHLRRLESQFGVQSVAMNMDEKNWGDAPRGRNG